MLWGLMGTVSLLIVYFTAVSLISDMGYAVSQFRQFWYFIVALAIGFGIQIGLYTYLKQEIKNRNATISGKTLAVTGTTSTLAMVSCCAHYLANIIPILGIAGALTIIAQYQIKLFWIGLIFNALGIAHIADKIIKIKKYSKSWRQSEPKHNF